MSNSENSFTENEENRRFYAYPKTYYYFLRVVVFFRKLRNDISEYVSNRKEDFKRKYPESYKKASDINVKTNQSFNNLKEWFNEKMETQVSPESTASPDIEFGITNYGSKSLGRFIPQTKMVNLETIQVDSDYDSESSVKSVKSNKSDDIVIIVRDSDNVLPGNAEIYHIGDNEGLEKEC
jgi:hypothetical protein